MRILRKYQLDIIFLFFALLLIAWTFFYALKYIGADPHNYEWHITLPLLFIYIAVLANQRAKIALSDRRALTSKSLAYWTMLGIMLFASY